MKTKLVSVLLAGLALAMAGCSHFQSPIKKSAAAAPLGAPPPVTAANALTPNAPGPNGRLANGMTAPRRPQWVSVSVFNNLLDARPATYYSNATVLATNKRILERMALQAGDRLFGIRNEAGILEVVIIPPGESFAIPDLGFARKMTLKAVIINDKDERIGYVPVDITWPAQGYGGAESPWDVVSGPVDPMITLPSGPSQSAQMAPVLTPTPRIP